MDQVEGYIIELLRDEAPKSQYRSFSMHEIIEYVKDKFIEIDVGPIYDLIEKLSREGFIYRPNGKNYKFNSEAG